jgi:N-acetylneuraminic acid mutarotase
LHSRGGGIAAIQINHNKDRAVFNLRSLIGLMMAFALLLLAACGGGGSSDNETPTLVSIQITPPATSKAMGLTQQYGAIGTYASGPNQDITAAVAWNSSDPAKASINASGLATATGVGAATVTASLGGVTSNNAVLTVNDAALVSIQITPPVASKAIGLKQQYSAIGTYTAGPNQDITATVAWQSSDAAKASVNATELATATGAGSSNISAALDGIDSNTAVLTVTSATLVSIQITPASASKAIGLTQQFTATGTYSDASTPDITASVSWNSSDTARATIGDGGLATAVNAGSTNITASLSGVTSNAAGFTVTATATATGPLASARRSHTATKLTDGKVLVSGGVGNAAILASSELYDPATGQWTATGALGSARFFHTATLLADGKVLVSGGYDDAAILASSELYDPATGQWTATGSLASARHFHTATLLADGKVLVSGGYGNAGDLVSYGNAGELASSELYDPATGQWTATGALVSARHEHTATLLADGKVLVSGGYRNGGPLTSSELYDPAIGQWTAMGALASARHLHTATLMADGKVLVSGGRGNVEPVSGSVYILASSELYDPATGQWTATGALASARYLHTATLLADGKVLVSGGYGNAAVLASSELYDPATGQWTATGALASARFIHTATMLADGKVLVTGGIGNTGNLASSELY